MNLRSAAAGLGGACAVMLGGLAVAQAALTWPQVSRADVEICRPIFAEVHRLEEKYIAEEAATYCTQGARDYDAGNCKTMRDGLAETKAKDDVDWYYKGNDHCEGSDYPCFGPGLYNDPRTGEEATYWAGIFFEGAAKPARVTPDMDFNAGASESDRCIAQVWVKKFKAANPNYTGGSQVAKSTPAPAPKAAVAPAGPPLGKDAQSCLDTKQGAAPRTAACDAALASARTDDPDYADLIFQMVSLQLGAGKPMDAIAWGDKLAASMTGGDAQLYRCLVRVVAKWELGAALAACAATGKDKDPAVLELQGQIQLLSGKYQQAWDSFSAAVSGGGDASALFMRGLASAALGKMGEAMKDMGKAEESAPGTTDGYAKDGYTIAAVTGGKPMVGAEAMGTSRPLQASASGGGAPKLTDGGPGKFAPDAPRGAPEPLGPLEAQACDAEIKALQVESKNWHGSPDEIALKLGMIEKTIFTSRCSGHSDAAAQVASAQRIIDGAGAAAAAVRTTADQTTPSVTDCLEPIPPGDSRNPGGYGVFQNKCTYPVYFNFCIVSPRPGSWADTFACEAAGTLALDAIGANNVQPALLGRQVTYFACRKPALPVTTYNPGSKSIDGYCK